MYVVIYSIMTKHETNGYRLQVRLHGIGGAVDGSAANFSIKPCGDIDLDHGSEVQHVFL